MMSFFLSISPPLLGLRKKGWGGSIFFPILLFLAAIITSSIIAWYVLMYGSRVEGWASLMVVILFLSGMQMLSLGVMGEYIWRNLEETRKRPHYIIKDVIKRAGQ